jgi:hypothetical protein
LEEGWLVLLLHHNFALVVESAIVPVSAVPEVRFTGYRAYSHVGGFGFVVRATLVAAALGMAVFRIWHFI